MKGILDTHTFIWMDSEPTKLSPNVRLFLQDPTNLIFLSVASVWEMVIKQRLGKLTLRMPLPTIIHQQRSNGLLILEAKLDHVLALENLPLHHKDPFDRLLIAQTNVEGAALLSGDAAVSQYAVNIVW